MMFCAECGTQKTRHEHGAWVICCNGIGYWYSEGPTADDLRMYGSPTTYRHVSVASQNYIDFYFYPTVKWPKRKQPHPPKL